MINTFFNNPKIKRGKNFKCPSIGTKIDVERCPINLLYAKRASIAEFINASRQSINLVPLRARSTAIYF